MNENNKNSERSNGDDEIPTLRRGRGIANRIGTSLEGGVGVGARPVSLVERLNQVCKRTRLRPLNNSFKKVTGSISGKAQAGGK